MISRALLGLLAVGFLGGCASVRSTAAYYVPYTAKYYSPKSPETDIPIVGKPPQAAHVTIGRLAFESSQGWKFLRKSMVYNAQVNGADLVVLKKVSNRQQVYLNEVPPQFDWVPFNNYYQNRKGRYYGYTNWVPIYRPGYVQQYVDDITAIDAEMVVLKK